MIRSPPSILGFRTVSDIVSDFVWGFGFRLRFRISTEVSDSEKGFEIRNWPKIRNRNLAETKGVSATCIIYPFCACELNVTNPSIGLLMDYSDPSSCVLILVLSSHVRSSILCYQGEIFLIPCTIPIQAFYDALQV